MRASHHEKDKKNSTKICRSTHRNPQPINPGEIYTYEIEVMPVRTGSKKGIVYGWKSSTVIHR